MSLISNIASNIAVDLTWKMQVFIHLNFEVLLFMYDGWLLPPRYPGWTKLQKANDSKPSYKTKIDFIRITRYWKAMLDSSLIES